MFGLQLRFLSFFFGLISILSFFNIIYSYYFNLYLNLNTYYFSFIFSLVICILFYRINFFESKQSIFNKILTVFLGYILIPLVLSIPFYFSIYNLTLLNSFFESIMEIFYSMDWRFIFSFFNNFFNWYIWWEFQKNFNKFYIF